MDTNTKAVLRFLKINQSITFIDSVRYCGESHFHRSIKNIERQGVKIIRQWEKNEITGKRYYRYFLVKNT